jgi:hypothetical protein
MGRVEKPELPQMHGVIRFGGYSIMKKESSGGYGLWDDNGKIGPDFDTEEQAIEWASTHPKGTRKHAQTANLSVPRPL